MATKEVIIITSDLSGKDVPTDALGHAQQDMFRPTYCSNERNHPRRTYLMATAKTKNNSTTRKMNTEAANEERINDGLERIADEAAKRLQAKIDTRERLMRYTEERRRPKSRRRP